MHNNKLLIIGGVSTDTLHLQDSTVKCAGGAGMYTSIASTHCGAEATLFGPRPPKYVDHIAEVNEYLFDWIGPILFSSSQQATQTMAIHRLLHALQIQSTVEWWFYEFLSTHWL